MEKITVDTSGSKSDIYIGEKLESVIRLVPSKGTIIITDKNIRQIYGNRFPDFPVLTIEPGEESKRIEIVEYLANQLLQAGADRSAFILAIGGGVVSDLGGFLAAIYMRGVKCGYVSTSLLSQVDASIGGKNGVNAGGVKNILGIIRQPEFVICDPEMLSTLPEEEYLSGLAELIKTAVIGDRTLFYLIESNIEGILDRDPILMGELISRSVRFKASIVAQDENEKGIRKILNFGHTFGHAIEMKRSVSHGFAVAAGMELAAQYSYETGLIGEDEKQRIISLLDSFTLLDHKKLPVEEIEELILHDKKKAGKDISFVFTEGIGKAVIRQIPVHEIVSFYRRFTGKNS